jgi:hypothetical protein
VNRGRAIVGSTWRRRVLVLTFLESFSTILLERGIYFFSHDKLGYSEAENLTLAVGFGASYTAGAYLSHPLSRRLGERFSLGVLLGGLFMLHALLGAFPGGVALPVAFCIVGLLEGAKWPIVESYVGAGLGPDDQLRAVGRFNVSWAIAVPLAVAATGPIITLGHPGALFALAAAVNVASLAFLPALPSHAPHLDGAHPSRPPAAVIERYRRLLTSSRWSMLSSYALLFLLAPLAPVVFQRLGQSVEDATLWAAVLDAVRFSTFAVLAVIPVWHGRVSPLLLGTLGLPLGFAAILAGGSLWLVLLGEIVFGVLAGFTYYAALFYALVVKNAAVDAGGAHEGLIGIGLVLGPLLGLAGQIAVRSGGSHWLGIAMAVLPLVAVCWLGSLRSLLRSSAA